MDYAHRIDQAEKATLSDARPYDESAIQWGALKVMMANDDPDVRVRALRAMLKMANREAGKLREIIELLVQENESLKDAIHSLETEHQALEVVYIHREPDGADWTGTGQSW